jgi:hypothetical protein
LILSGAFSNGIYQTEYSGEISWLNSVGGLTIVQALIEVARDYFNLGHFDARLANTSELEESEITQVMLAHEELTLTQRKCFTEILKALEKISGC